VQVRKAKQIEQQLSTGTIIYSLVAAIVYNS